MDDIDLFRTFFGTNREQSKFKNNIEANIQGTKLYFTALCVRVLVGWVWVPSVLGGDNGNKKLPRRKMVVRI